MKVTRKQFYDWKRDKSLICVLECRKCHKIHEFRKKAYLNFNCDCGQNIIFAGLINFVNDILYKSKFMYQNSLKKFDPYR